MGLIQSLPGKVKARFGFSGALSDEISMDNRGHTGWQLCLNTVNHLLHSSFFLLFFMKIRMVSTSDIECLVKYTISVDYWHKQKSLPLWWRSCFIRMTVTLSHILKMKCNVLWTVFHMHVKFCLEIIYIYIYIYGGDVCVCVYVYIYIYIYTHTNIRIYTHRH